MILSDGKVRLEVEKCCDNCGVETMTSLSLRFGVPLFGTAASSLAD